MSVKHKQRREHVGLCSIFQQKPGERQREEGLGHAAIHHHNKQDIDHKSWQLCSNRDTKGHLAEETGRFRTHKAGGEPAEPRGTAFCSVRFWRAVTVTRFVWLQLCLLDVCRILRDCTRFSLYHVYTLVLLFRTLNLKLDSSDELTDSKDTVYIHL